jgi:hypothetical protein
MKILFVSTTLWAGTHIRWTMAMNQYTEHEARCLSPGMWYTKRLFDKDFPHSPPIYSVNDAEMKNALIDWADVIHCSYVCSPHTLGRPDILGKKIVCWHLALKWGNPMWLLFPKGQHRHVRFLLGCEGWERYQLPSLEWHLVPQIFLLESKEYQHAGQRQKVASISPRTRGGLPFNSNFRGVQEIKRRLNGIKWRLISRTTFMDCMRQKATSWVGIDDVLRPVVHLSGMEYLGLGIPCINSVDKVLQRSIQSTLDSPPVPFIHGTMSTLRQTCVKSLRADEDLWLEKSAQCRQWMLDYYHPKTVVEKYLEVYKKS